MSGLDVLCLAEVYEDQWVPRSSHFWSHKGQPNMTRGRTILCVGFNDLIRYICCEIFPMRAPIFYKILINPSPFSFSSDTTNPKTHLSPRNPSALIPFSPPDAARARYTSSYQEKLWRAHELEQRETPEAQPPNLLAELTPRALSLVACAALKPRSLRMLRALSRAIWRT